MYKVFFGLNRNPFELSPDPSFRFSSKKCDEALASIYHGILRRQGFAVLTGEVGTGKTLIVRCLCESWKHRGIPFANVIGPRLSVTDFLSYITFDLGIQVTERTKGNLLRALYGFLIAQLEKDLTTVLVVDEAHQVSPSVLEEIRLLTNLETNQQKLLQVLLVGQPELDEKLDSFELRQLKQRIAIRCRLEPLSEEEIRRYIERRLSLAGADLQANAIFPAETVGAIYSYSAGTPRVVNNICEQALVRAHARQIRVVPVEIIDEVATYFRLQPNPGLSQTEAPFSRAERAGNSVTEISWEPTCTVSPPAAKAFNPNTFSIYVNAPVVQPAQAEPGKPQTLFAPIDSQEDVLASALTDAVTEVSATETGGKIPGTIDSKKSGGMDVPSSPVVPEVAASIKKLIQNMEELVAAGRPSEADRQSSTITVPKKTSGRDLPASPVAPQASTSIKEVELLENVGGSAVAARNLSEAWGSTFGRLTADKVLVSSSRAVLGGRNDAHLGTGMSPHAKVASNSGQKWKLIAPGIVLLMVAAGCGVFLLRLGGAWNAVNPVLVVTAPALATNADDNSDLQVRQSTLVSNPVAEVRPASEPKTTALETPLTHRPSERAQSQSGTPTQRPASNVWSDRFNPLAVHPTVHDAEEKKVDPASGVNPGSISFNDSSAPPALVSSSGLVIPPLPNSTPETPRRGGGQLEQPRLLSTVPVTYPVAAQQTHTEGDVVIQTVIDQAGKVTDMHVVSGPQMLRQAALDSLRRWRYEPGRLDGQLMAVQMLVTIRFHP